MPDLRVVKRRPILSEYIFALWLFAKVSARLMHFCNHYFYHTDLYCTSDFGTKPTCLWGFVCNQQPSSLVDWLKRYENILTYFIVLKFSKKKRPILADCKQWNKRSKQFDSFLKPSARSNNKPVRWFPHPRVKLFANRWVHKKCRVFLLLFALHHEVRGLAYPNRPL